MEAEFEVKLPSKLAAAGITFEALSSLGEEEFAALLEKHGVDPENPYSDDEDEAGEQGDDEAGEGSDDDELSMEALSSLDEAELQKRLAAEEARYGGDPDAMLSELDDSDDEHGLNDPSLSASADVKRAKLGRTRGRKLAEELSEDGCVSVVRVEPFSAMLVYVFVCNA